MKLLLDACVMYPTVMRSVLLGAAKKGFFTPVWSERILEEWARAARKLGLEGEIQARSEVALVKANWPQGAVANFEGLEKRLWLPDPADIHVLAAAIKASADGIVTVNAKDFPKNVLAEEGLTRIDPDTLLVQFFAQNSHAITEVAELVKGDANRLSGETWEMRALMKKARLPKLGKALIR